MKLKSFHWTRRTVVYALIGQAVLLALAVIWRSNGGVLSAHYNVTTTDGRIAYLQALGAGDRDPACVQRCIQRLQRPAKAAGI